MKHAPTPTKTTPTQRQFYIAVAIILVLTLALIQSNSVKKTTNDIQISINSYKKPKVQLATKPKFKPPDQQISTPLTAPNKYPPRRKPIIAVWDTESWFRHLKAFPMANFSYCAPNNNCDII